MDARLKTERNLAHNKDDAQLRDVEQIRYLNKKLFVLR